MYWDDRISSHAKDPERLWATFTALVSRRLDRPGSPEESSFTAHDFRVAYTTKTVQEP